MLLKILRAIVQVYLLSLSCLLSGQLIQSKFPLQFTGGACYNFFDKQDAKTNFILEWKLEKSVMGTHFGLNVKLREFPFAFCSRNNQKLIGFLYISNQDDTWVIFPKTEKSILTWKNKKSSDLHISFPITISLPSRQMVLPGEYKCYLDVSLQGEDREIIFEEVVELMIRVLPVQKIEILMDGKKQGSNKTLRIDFPVSSEISTRTFQIEVLSNVPCEVQCKSVNDGKLKMHSDNRRANYANIDMLYTLSYQERKIDLKNGYNLLLHHSSFDCQQAVKYPLSLTIHPNLKNNWEGIYEDEITFSIRSGF